MEELPHGALLRIGRASRRAHPGRRRTSMDLKDKLTAIAFGLPLVILLMGTFGQ